VDHPKTLAFEKDLREAFIAVDHYLEDKYADLFPLHPNRPKRGETSNPQMDGLFNVGSSFSAGYGSEYGRGYVVDVHISTLERIPKGRKESILEDAVEELRRQLARRFPGRKLFVDRDRHVFKVHGDFSLGSL
jgi:hypothetical protein